MACLETPTPHKYLPACSIAHKPTQIFCHVQKAQAGASALSRADAFLFFCRDVSTLDENNAVYNNQTAFDILQKEFGIAPIMSASDFASSKEIDQLSVVLYLTQVHNAFSETPKPAGTCVFSTSITFDLWFWSWLSVLSA